MGSKKEFGKERLVKAALKLFAKHGVSGTKLKDLAKEAKVDAPLIHYYFKTQAELELAVIEQVLVSLKNESLKYESEKTPEKKLEVYLRAPFVWSKKNPGLFSIWMYFYYMASFSEEFTELNDQIRKNGRERIEFILYQFGIKKEKVEKLAHEIQGIITGQTILYGTENGLELEKCADMTVESVFALIKR